MRDKAQRLHDQLPLTGVGEHLPHQVGGAQRYRFNLLDGGAHRRFRRKLHEGEARVAQDGREKIIEIVGDAAGENAKAFELLTVLHLGFQSQALGLGPLARGNVVGQRHDPCLGALGVTDHGRG